MEHSAILLTCIRPLLVLKSFWGVFFEWPLKTGFTVHEYEQAYVILVLLKGPTAKAH